MSKKLRSSNSCNIYFFYEQDTLTAEQIAGKSFSSLSDMIIENMPHFVFILVNDQRIQRNINQ